MDFEELLIKYLANLDLKRVEYRVSKDFLSLLHDGLQDSMIDSINENVLGRHRNRLGKKLDLHKDLGIKDTRDRICSDHQAILQEDPNWFTTTPRRVTADENDVTDLITSVELIHILIVRCRADFPAFELNQLEVGDVTSLSKLICAFTDDFKIVEIYLQYFKETQDYTSYDKLFYAISEMNCASQLREGSYSEAAHENLKRLLIDYMDMNLIEKEVEKSYGFLDQEEFDLAQNLTKYQNSLHLVSLLCENSHEVQDKFGMTRKEFLEILARFWENNFLLRKLILICEAGDEAARRININTTNKTAYMYAQNILVCMLPLLRFAIEAELLVVGTCVKEVEIMLSKNYFIEEFRRNDEHHLVRFRRYLNALKG